MMRLLGVLLLIVVSLHFSYSQAKTLQRPKIGLVLSGGGAKGMAHVGLLKVLEEVGIKPDYITGTSMGSIVGGLYAIGYSASEIEDILKKQNWADVLSNQIPLKEISINEKDQYGQYFAEFPIRGVKVSLPKGLIYGQQIMNLLSHYTLPAYKIHDFNKLPIPFKCIAADITNANAVVIDTGNIAIAMRSSMAIPSVFTPVKYMNRLLVDGGLVHNFPVDEVKQMGADIVIGEYTGVKLKNKEQLNSMVSILSQSAFFMGVFNAKEQRKLVDIYIEPDLTGFTTADFPKVDSIISRGEVAAREHIDEFKALAEKLKHFDNDVKNKRKLIAPDSLIVENIVTDGVDPNYREFVLGRLGLLPKVKFSIHELEDGIGRIYGTRYFDKVYYTFNNLPDNKLQLVIHAEGRPSGYISMSAHYDSEKRAGFLVNLLVRDFFVKSSRFSLTANISENPGFQLDWFKYFGRNRRYTLGFQSNINSFEVPLYVNGNKNELFRLNYTNIGIYTRYSILNNSRLCLFTKVERSLITPVVSQSDVFERWLVTNKQIAVRFETNTLNQKYFPDNGINTSLTYQYNFNINYKDGSDNSLNKLFNREFSNIIFHFDSYKKVFNRFTFHNFFHAGVLFGENYSIVKNYYAGGNNNDYAYLLPFVGFGHLEYTDNQIFIGGAGVRVEPFNNFYVEPMANLLVSNQYLSMFVNNIDDEKFVLGFGMELGYNTIIGPIVASVSSNTFNYMFRGFFNIGYRYQF